MRQAPPPPHASCTTNSGAHAWPAHHRQREALALFWAPGAMCKRWVGGRACARAPDLLQKAPPLLPPPPRRQTHIRVCRTCCIPSRFGPPLSGVGSVGEPLSVSTDAGAASGPLCCLPPACRARPQQLQPIEPLPTRDSAFKGAPTGHPRSLYGRFTKTQPSGWRANEMKWISAQCRLSSTGTGVEWMRFLGAGSTTLTQGGLHPIHRLPGSLLLLLPSLPLRQRALRMPVPLRFVLLPPAGNLQVRCRGRGERQ